jgi:hypothetical protein
VLSADILNHFVVKDIKFFACQSDFYAIASRKYMLRTGNDNICRYLFSFSYKFCKPDMTEEAPPKSEQDTTPSPFKNLTGVAISATLATGLYSFTNMMAHKLALAPLQTTNTLANRLATLVRTLLLAIGTGATMIFAVIAIGLVLLTIKQMFTNIFSKSQT